MTSQESVIRCIDCITLYIVVTYYVTCILCEDEFRSEHVSNIINDVRQHYHVCCATFIIKDMEQSSVILTLTKNLHIVYTRTCSIFPTMFSDIFSSTYKNTHLFVFPYSDFGTRHILKNLSSTINMSHHVWLLFLYPSNFTIKDFFKDVLVPFNCKFLVVQKIHSDYTLTEVYNVSPKSSLNTRLCGTWNFKYGLNMSTEYIYNKRKYLDGVLIKAATIQDAPFTTVGNNSGTVYLKKGYLGRIWSALEMKINFTSVWTPSSDHIWGVLENGSWNGMVEIVRSNEVEVAVAAFIINSQRQKVVDYTLPVFTTNQQIFIRAPRRNKIAWNDFLLPLACSTWFTVIGVVIILTICMSVIFWVGFKTGNEDKQVFHQFVTMETLFIVFGAFCQQGSHVVPRSISCRVVLITCYLTAIIVLGSYSAGLISYLTKQIVEFPFDSFEGLIKDGSYKFSVLKKSAEYDFFKESNDTVLKRVYEKFLLPHKDSLPNSKKIAIEQLCHQDKYAFFSTSTHLRILKEGLKCNVIALPIRSFTATYAIIWNKNSWYKDIVNYYLRKFRDSGTLKRILLDEIPRPDLIIHNTWNSVSIQNVFPIFLMFLFGGIIACLLFYIERTVCGNQVHYNTHIKSSRHLNETKYYELKITENEGKTIFV